MGHFPQFLHSHAHALLAGRLHACHTLLHTASLSGSQTAPDRKLPGISRPAMVYCFCLSHTPTGPSSWESVVSLSPISKVGFTQQEQEVEDPKGGWSSFCLAPLLFPSQSVFPPSSYLIFSGFSPFSIRPIPQTLWCGLSFRERSFFTSDIPMCSQPLRPACLLPWNTVFPDRLQDDFPRWDSSLSSVSQPCFSAPRRRCHATHTLSPCTCLFPTSLPPHRAPFPTRPLGLSGSLPMVGGGALTLKKKKGELFSLPRRTFYHL